VEHIRLSVWLRRQRHPPRLLIGNHLLSDVPDHPAGIKDSFRFQVQSSKLTVVAVSRPIRAPLRLCARRPDAKPVESG